MRRRVDILNLEWATDSRDTNIVDPVLFSLHDRFKYSVVCDSIWYFLLKLLWYRPRVLLISNDVGATINVNAFRFAKFLGIMTVTLSSEGLHYQSLKPAMQKEFNNALFWGNNSLRKNYSDLKLVWSIAIKREFLRDVDQSKEYNIKVSGATGFDRYTLFPSFRVSKEQKRIKSKYSKRILLVGLGFDTLNSNLGNREKNGVCDDELIQRFNFRTQVRDIYRTIIEKNPEVLFIIKHHPGSVNLEETEFEGLDCYENTEVYHREINIMELVGVSDFVIAFESTVCMEAWLMGKITVLVNPPGTAFTRSNLYKGSVIVDNAEILQKIIEEYYNDNRILAFDELANKRYEILEDQIQFYDGANYLRAAKLIDDFIKSNPIEKVHFNKNDLTQIVLEFLSEIKGAFVEFTVIGLLNKKARLARKSNSTMYNKVVRKKNLRNYGKAIRVFEKKHHALVEEICGFYKG